MAKNDNLVVAHYLNGKLTKGAASDFKETKDSFRIYSAQDQIEGTLVYVDELKGLFFVKSLEGNPDRRDRTFSEEEIRDLAGMKLRIEFSDGEVMYAMSEGYSPARKGFFVVPLDPESNNEKVYVNKASTCRVVIVR